MVLTQDDEAEAGPGWPDRTSVMACGAIFVAFSAVWLFLALRNLNVEWQSRRWPTTTGIAVRTWSNDDGSQDVTYDYVVARGQYRAEDTLRYARKGDEVTVRYNPLRPDQSTLNDGIQGRTVGVVFGGVVMMMFGAGMLMFPARAAAFFNQVG